MNKQRRFLYRIVSLTICLLLLISCQVFAEEDLSESHDIAPTQLFIVPSETNGIPSQIDAFKMQTGGTDTSPTYTYQLYLPGDANLANTFLSWDGDMQATVDGTTYDSGACPIPSPGEEKTITFQNDNTTVASFTVSTFQGSSSVPAVFIVIDESGENPTIAEMDASPNHSVSCTGTICIDGTWYGLSKIKGRGNTTWKESLDKKPYNITLDTKINFPGIDSEKTKTWSMLAENLDRSLLANRSGYYLAYELGIGQDTSSADVWMNGEYQGCYTISAKSNSFVSEDGYIIEQDNYLEAPVAEGGDPQFKLNGLIEASDWDSCYNRITVKGIGDNLLKDSNGVVDESPENLTAVAAEIQSWLQDAWDAIRSSTGFNSKNKYYTDYIDIESFAKMYLMHEYVKSYDVCAGSIFFHRDGQGSNDKLIAGPLWDLDNAMGSTYQNSALGKADDRSNGDRRSGQGNFIINITEYKTSIFKTLSKHEDFMKEVAKQYNKNKRAFEALEDDTEQLVDEIEASALMNYNKVIDMGNDTGKNNFYYDDLITLGSGQYVQNYVATSSWDTYTTNLLTYIRTRSLWFNNNYTIDPADCTHEYEATEYQAATCTADGFQSYKCSICGDNYTETLSKIAHDYQNGECSVCHEVLRTVTFACDRDASITVYETNTFNGTHADHVTSANPRNGDTGWIDCGGDGQVNFVVNPPSGYEIVSISATPATSYNSLISVKNDTGIENSYRLTNVSGDLTVTVKLAGSVSFDPNGGTGEMAAQKINIGGMANLTQNSFTKTYYTFSGWNTKADGSGTSYKDQSAFTMNENTTLYAQWVETAHVYGDWTVTKDATCTATGTKKRTCSVCGNIETQTIAAKGHSYGNWKVTKAATCTATGTQERTCSTCGNKETQTIAAKGHSWKSDYTVDKAATCTVAGSKSIHCSVCDAKKDGSAVTIPATGHSYGSWKVTKAATCTATGTQERTCSTCGNKETQTIAATGHDLTHHAAVKEDFEHDGNSEYWSCSRCKKYFSDKEAKTEIAANSWVIPNKKQKYGNHTGVVNDGGTIVYLTNGKPDTSVTGIYKYANTWYFVKKGYVDTSYNSVEKNENGWWKITNGKVDFNFSGVADNQNGTWYLKDGKVDFDYTGFAAGTAKGQSGWWYVEGGQVKFNRTDILSGTANTTADRAGVSGWWYIKNSKVANVNTVAKNANGWWAVRNGKVDFNYTGFADNENGWWYVEKGQVTFDKNDVIKGTANNEAGKTGEAGWWLVRGSKVMKETTIAKNSNGWWRIENGKVNFNYTGVAKNEYGWWYLKNGKVDFSYTGFASNEYGWWYVEAGQVTFGRNDVIKGKANNAVGKALEDGWWLVRGSKVTKATTVAKNANGWWYVKDGKVDFNYTGLGTNEYGTWYIKNGKVDFSYNGNYNGRRIVDGKVQ